MASVCSIGSNWISKLSAAIACVRNAADIVNPVLAVDSKFEITPFPDPVLDIEPIRVMVRVREGGRILRKKRMIKKRNKAMARFLGFDCDWQSLWRYRDDLGHSFENLIYTGTADESGVSTVNMEAR